MLDGVNFSVSTRIIGLPWKHRFDAKEMNQIMIRRRRVDYGNYDAEYSQLELHANKTICFGDMLNKERMQ